MANFFYQKPTNYLLQGWILCIFSFHYCIFLKSASSHFSSFMMAFSARAILPYVLNLILAALTMSCSWLWDLFRKACPFNIAPLWPFLICVPVCATITGHIPYESDSPPESVPLSLYSTAPLLCHIYISSSHFSSFMMAFSDRAILPYVLNLILAALTMSCNWLWDLSRKACPFNIAPLWPFLICVPVCATISGNIPCESDSPPQSVPLSLYHCFTIVIFLICV